MREDVAIASEMVNRLVVIGLNQNQFDAVTSLVFNVGAPAFERSRALKALNRRDFSIFVTEAFDRNRGFVKADGMVLDGLVNRRTNG